MYTTFTVNDNLLFEFEGDKGQLETRYKISWSVEKPQDDGKQVITPKLEPD